MNATWAVRLEPRQAGAAASLRLRPRVEVLETADGLWLRGDESSEELDRALRKLPTAGRYSVLPDGRLIEPGARLPKGRLPAGAWGPLIEWSLPAAVAPHLAGRVASRVPLRLVPSGAEREPRLLLTSLSCWAAWAAQAPAIRLRSLRFAADDSGRGLVHGLPVPPLPGVRYVESDGVAIPCGYTWRPAVDASVVRARLALGDEDLALFHPDGSFERIEGKRFVRASRSAVRLTLTTRSDGTP